MHTWRVITLLALLALLVGVADAQDEDSHPPYDGPSRQYLSFAPSWFPDAPADLESPLPLVIMLHGSGGNGMSMAQLSGIHEFAERDGFIVIYPDGFQRQWNDGLRERPISDIDDTAFLLELIDSLIDQGIADPEQVFLVGFSNGGGMAYRLACEAPGYFRGIAAVSAALGLRWQEDCLHGEGPLSVLVMHGTEDDVFYFHRGMRDVETLETVTFSPAGAASFWAAYNDCGINRRITLLPDTDPDDDTRVRRTLYESCENGAQVAFYAVLGGGHSWPGQREPLTRGPVSRDIDATEVIWDFLTGQP